MHEAGNISNAKQGGTSASLSVLIADDEPMVLMITQQLLQDSGFNVFAAEDGKKAVEVFEAHAGEIGCVVLDVTMPQLNGEDAARRIRAIRPGTRILLATGMGGTELLERMAGVVDGYVQKPFRIDDLCARLRSIMA